MNYLEDNFDINNLEHLKAYRHLQNVGYWPEGFFESNGFSLRCKDGSWEFFLKQKLINAWLDHKLDNRS